MYPSRVPEAQSTHGVTRSPASDRDHLGYNCALLSCQIFTLSLALAVLVNGSRGRFSIGTARSGRPRSMTPEALAIAASIETSVKLAVSG